MILVVKIESRIASYVCSRYSEKDLCLLRLLSSFEGFRKAAFHSDIPGLLGMPLVTFEKYLREEHGIEFRSGAGRSVTLLCGGRVVCEYEDDVLSSITGKLVAELRSLYPEADRLSSSPLVQVVRGASIDNILRGFDLSDIIDRFLNIEGAANKLHDFDGEAFNNIAEALLEENPAKIHKYRAVEMLHQLAVQARTGDLVANEGAPYPFNNETEFMDVWLGVLPNRSLRHPAKTRLSRAMVSHFSEICPDAVLSEDGTEMIRGVSTVRLLDILGLTESTLAPLTAEMLLEARTTPLVGKPSVTPGGAFFRAAAPFHRGTSRQRRNVSWQRSRRGGTGSQGCSSWDRSCHQVPRLGRQFTASRGAGGVHLWVPRGQGVYRQVVPEEKERSLQASASRYVSGRGGDHEHRHGPETGNTCNAHRRTVGFNGGCTAADPKRWMGHRSRR